MAFIRICPRKPIISFDTRDFSSSFEKSNKAYITASATYHAVLVADY